MPVNLRAASVGADEKEEEEEEDEEEEEEEEEEEIGINNKEPNTGIRINRVIMG